MAPPVLLSAEGASLRSKRRISETEEGDHGVGPDAAAVSDDGDGGAVEFLLLASDGLWDVFEDQEAVDFVRARLCAGDSAETCAARLTNAALERQSKDDTTVVLYVIDQALLVVPTRYDAAAVTSMPSMPEVTRGEQRVKILEPVVEARPREA